MGGSQSNERGRRPPIPHQPVPPSYSSPYAPPPVYSSVPGQYPVQPYYGGSHPSYQPVYPHPGGMQAPPQQPYLPDQYGQPPRAPVPTAETTTTATIRNQVNLKKQTLALQPTSQPGVFGITFSFDASAPCRVTTFVCAHEDTRRSCKITTSIPPAPACSFPKGLNHKFPTTSATAAAHVVNTLRANAKDLTTAVADTFPVIIRLEALTEDANAGGGGEARSLESLDPGCELPQWVQSQTTYARLVKEDDGSWGLRVIKQKIWVKGTAYELQEIYGMEQNNKAQGGGEGFEDVDGNECVICMSAPRDTTALPCRHMCMCHGCASALKTQTNKCPICRNEIESLLHIKINKPGAPAPAPGAGAPAARGGAPTAAPAAAGAGAGASSSRDAACKP